MTFLFWRISHRSNACPDCRTNISGTKKIYLKLSNDDDDADEPISDAVWMATINGLTEKVEKYENDITRLKAELCSHETVMIVLRMQSKQKTDQLKQLEKMDRERKRKLVTLHRELDAMKASAKTDSVKYKQLCAELNEKDETIGHLNSVIKSMEAKNEQKLQKIQKEYGALNEKMVRMNKCIDGLNMRPHFDELMNRRVTRSHTQRKIKGQSLARQK